jgi:hypothetical protein
VLVTALAGCGGDAPQKARSAGSTASVTPTATHSAKPGPTVTNRATSPTRTTSPPRVTSSPKAPARPSPTATYFPYASTAPIEVTLTPRCVKQGGRITIDIKTLPNSTAGYQAVYAGEKGGAPQPMGYGYGGNAGGRVYGDGHYKDTWTVSLAAPVGPARVDAVASTKKGYGNVQKPFTVVAAGGRCP